MPEIFLIRAAFVFAQDKNDNIPADGQEQTEPGKEKVSFCVISLIQAHQQNEQQYDIDEFKNPDEKVTETIKIIDIQSEAGQIDPLIALLVFHDKTGVFREEQRLGDGGRNAENGNADRRQHRIQSRAFHFPAEYIAGPREFSHKHQIGKRHERQPLMPEPDIFSHFVQSHALENEQRQPDCPGYRRRHNKQARGNIAVRGNQTERKNYPIN